MKTVEARQYEMLVRVRGFGREHATLFAHQSLAAEQLAAIEAAVEAVRGHSMAAILARRDGAGVKRAARHALLEQIKAIVRTARAIGRDDLEVADRFRLPKPLRDGTLLVTGHVFVQHAGQFKDQFVRHAMPPTFIVDLDDLVQRFERAIQDRHARMTEQIMAQGSIEVALASGLVAVRTLDAVLTNLLRHDPEMLAAWRRDRQVKYPSLRRRRAAEPAAPASAARAPADA